MKKKFTILFIVFFIYIGFGFKILPIILKDQIVKNLDENLTEKSYIEKIEFNPFNLKTKVYNFILGTKKEKPLIKIEELVLDYGLLTSILKLHINVEEIKLKNSTINIIEDKNGEYNLVKILKPSKEEKKEEESSSSIDFLVSKLILENINIDFKREIKGKKDYHVSLKDINYDLYDLGTYKNKLSSNDFKLNINKDTKLSIVGAFNLKPFKMYGKAKIENLKIRDIIEYKKDILNFDINENANLDLSIDYNIDTERDIDVKITSNKLQLKNINLKQDNKSIFKLSKFDIKKLDFDLNKQNVKLDNINLNKPYVNLILKNKVLNFSNLIKEEKKEKENLSKTNKESKPWNIDINNLNLNNSTLLYNDIDNQMYSKNENFNFNVSKTNIKDSDVFINSIKLTNPNLNFSDEKNLFFIDGNNVITNIDKIKIKDSNTSIENIKILKDKISYFDKKSNLVISSYKPDLKLKNITIDNKNTNLKEIKLFTSNLNLENNETKLNIKSNDLNFNINSLDINEEIILSKINLNHKNLLIEDESIKLLTKKDDIELDNISIIKEEIKIPKIELNTTELSFKEKKQNLNINTNNTKINLNNLSIKNNITSIKEMRLSNPSIKYKDSLNHLNTEKLSLVIDDFTQEKDEIKLGKIKFKESQLNFQNIKDKTKIDIKNIDLIVNQIANSNEQGLSIKKADLINPKVSIVLAKNKNKKTKEIKKENKKDSATSKIRIGPINIKNALLNFEDKNLQIPFKTKISNLNGKVSDINTISKKDITNLLINGTVDKYGTAKISGIINPENIKILTDVKMKLKNINMNNFSPYSGQFVGRKIDSGKLELDLNYNIKKSKLKAKNNIIIKKIKFGKTVKSPDAISLPLDLAITLLEDPSGVIDINLPLTGNLDDPQFSIVPLVWQAFSNLILKAVTSPFSLLGAVFGFSEDEIKQVQFDFGAKAIEPEQKETLDKLALILKKRTNLAIKLTGTYNSKLDLKALKAFKFKEKINNEFPDKTIDNYKKEYLNFIEDMYDDLDGNLNKLKKKNTINDKLNEKNYTSQLESFIISKQQINKNNLIDMSKKRVENIKNYLIYGANINEKQVITNKKIEEINNSSKKSSDVKLDISKL